MPRLLVVMAACAVVCGACAHTSGVSDPVEESDAEVGWKTPLPSTHRTWRLLANEQLVIALGESRDAENSDSLTLGLDPLTGEVLWQVSSASPKDRSPTRPLIEGERLVLVSRSTAVGIDVTSGEVAWTFDAADRNISGAQLADDGKLVMILDARVLAVVDADDGTWLRGVSIYPSVLMAVYDDCAVVGVVPGDGDFSRPALLAVELEGDGGGSPTPPFAEAKYLWRTSVTRRVFRCGWWATAS